MKITGLFKKIYLIIKLAKLINSFILSDFNEPVVQSG